MAKRTASNDLNHENWDTEDDPEDAGSFKRASADILKTRMFKTARRRNPIGSTSTTSTPDEGSPEKRNVFGGFTGFSKAPVSTTTAFGFLCNNQPKVNGISHLNTTNMNSTANTSDDKQHDEAYFSRLKGLNSSVASWIKRHVDENPFVNLKPVFQDYERYFNELELKKNSTSNKPLNESIASTSSNSKEFSFGVKPPANVEMTKSPPKLTTFAPPAAPTSNLTNMFNFGQQPPSKSALAPAPAQKFAFGTSSPQTTLATSTTSPASSMIFKPLSGSGFSFGGGGGVATQSVTSTPFAFTSASVSSTSKTGTAEGASALGEADDDEPPKVEFTPVDEEGYIYKIRCKVFVKKDKEKTFGDRGVGNMFLKPIPGTPKMQLIVRANTNLGNLLCNFVLSSSIPIKRLGKKDVMLVCIPTPDVAPPPVPILLRVKSPEEADELLTTLEKHKK